MSTSSPNSSPTVFENIISGKFPASFVFKDEVCVAFMDINPLNEGHVLVVPRLAVPKLTMLDGKTAAHLFLVAQKILKAMEASELKCEAANIFISDGEVAGQEVPHVHLHILPRFLGDGLRMSFGGTIKKSERVELDRVAGVISKNILTGREG